MATTRTEETTQVILKVNEGTTENVISKNRTFNHISPNATDDDVRTVVATPLSTLQSLPLISIQRVDKGLLVQSD